MSLEVKTALLFNKMYYSICGAEADTNTANAKRCVNEAMDYAIDVLEDMKIINITGNVLVEVLNKNIDDKITELKKLKESNGE